jgi:hypothetical protein
LIARVRVAIAILLVGVDYITAGPETSSAPERSGVNEKETGSNRFSSTALFRESAA